VSGAGGDRDLGLGKLGAQACYQSLDSWNIVDVADPWPALQMSFQNFRATLREPSALVKAILPLSPASRTR